ncbi:hypothetical protein Mpsy_1966 [Methanolobus psychrophilus R15]|nr:hypothetical protein Mpsy_1966 [Methanolobus psychrophilus R15]
MHIYSSGHLLLKTIPIEVRMNHIKKEDEGERTGPSALSQS